LKIEFQDVPFRALDVLAAELRSVGMVVNFDNESVNCGSGSAEGISGRLEFLHVGEHLTVTITEDKGHFPEAMLLGGIRQLVSEAVELVNK
jgi:hypothetical protein